MISITSLIIIDLLLLKQYNQQSNILLSFWSIYANECFLKSTGSESVAVLRVASILRELFHHRQGVFMGGFSMGMLKDYVDVFVFAVLGVASFLAVWFVIERVIFYSKVNLKAYDDIDALNLDLTKNLTILYVIYSNAPYVGLLGTVLGIMVIFYDMGMSGGMDAKTIMVGLSLALKATALGLAVAIPTLIAYNSLLRKSDVLSEKFRIMKK